MNALAWNSVMLIRAAASCIAWGLARVEADHPAAHAVTEPLGQQELGIRAHPCRDQRERDERPHLRAARNIREALSERTGHPHVKIGVLLEETAGSPKPDTLIRGAAAEEMLRRSERVEHGDLGIEQIDSMVGHGRLFEQLHRPITNRAAANSAASVSADRCTYFAVVSGDACPIRSRNTIKSIPAAASSVAYV